LPRPQVVEEEPEQFHPRDRPLGAAAYSGRRNSKDDSNPSVSKIRGISAEELFITKISIKSITHQAKRLIKYFQSGMSAR
jgi:hypothetical protein